MLKPITTSLASILGLGTVTLIVVLALAAVTGFEGPGGLWRSGTSPDPGQLTAGSWIWQRTERPDGTVIVAPDPSKYVISFHGDGRLAVNIDCNGGITRYALAGSNVTIEPMVLTLMFCPMNLPWLSFPQDLKEVASFGFEGDELTLQLKGRGGRMVFAPRPEMQAAR